MLKREAGLGGSGMIPEVFLDKVLGEDQRHSVFLMPCSACLASVLPQLMPSHLCMCCFALATPACVYGFCMLRSLAMQKLLNALQCNSLGATD